MASYQKKRNKVNPIVRVEVANVLVVNREATGQELKRMVEKSLKRKGFLFSYTVRTYQNIKNQLGAPLRGFDKPWSLGTYVPLADIAPLISLQRQLFADGLYLTTRRARWYAVLYPVLAPIMEQAYPDDTTQNELRIMQIASFYCRKEQIAEVNDVALYTSKLDSIFLIYQDIIFKAMLLEWFNLFLPDMEIPDILTLNIDENTELLLPFINTLTQSGVEQALLFIEENPKEQPLAERWMALSIRKDIEGIIKDGEK